jgi:TPR repeat protein
MFLLDGFHNDFFNVGTVESTETLEKLSKISTGVPEDSFLVGRALFLLKEPKCLEWIVTGANAGFALSMDLLGTMYVNGLFVERNVTRGLQWYECAADLGNTLAQYHLGMLYFYGKREVAQDFKKAMEYLTESGFVGYLDAFVWNYRAEVCINMKLNPNLLKPTSIQFASMPTLIQAG